MDKITVVDFSHLCMRMLYVATQETKPKLKDGKYITNEYQAYFKHLLFNSLQNIKNLLKGEMIIAIDSKNNWRKDIYDTYKGQRAKVRNESKVNFREYYELVNEIKDSIDMYFPFKILEVPKAEADDVGGVLSQVYGDTMDITLVTSDKDWFQVMVEHPKVRVYDPMKRSYPTIEKYDSVILDTNWGSISRYTLRHALKGDSGDNVMKINKDTEFSPNFLKYLKENGVKIKNVKDFRKDENIDLFNSLVNNYDVYKKITRGKNKGKFSEEKDIYKMIMLTKLDKKIESSENLNEFIYSHPLYLERFELNLKLVDFNRIPTEIKDDIKKKYNECKVTYNPDKIKEYFLEEGLSKLATNVNQFYDSRFEIEYEGLNMLEF